MKLELDLDQPAAITRLGESTLSPQKARILSTSNRRMIVVSETMAPIGSAVQVQWSHYLVLAEVVGIQDESRALILQIRHVLDMDDFKHIRQSWT